MATPQWKARLNRYHKFAVTQLCQFEEEERSEMLGQIIANWLRDHGELLDKAGASSQDWEAVRATWKPPVLRRGTKASEEEDGEED
jgi:hypothetical protein